jgi:hypothetical protein
VLLLYHNEKPERIIEFILYYYNIAKLDIKKVVQFWLYSYKLSEQCYNVN